MPVRVADAATLTKRVLPRNNARSRLNYRQNSAGSKRAGPGSRRRIRVLAVAGTRMARYQANTCVLIRMHSDDLHTRRAHLRPARPATTSMACWPQSTACRSSTDRGRGAPTLARLSSGIARSSTSSSTASRPTSWSRRATKPTSSGLRPPARAAHPDHACGPAAPATMVRRSRSKAACCSTSPASTPSNGTSRESSGRRPAPKMNDIDAADPPGGLGTAHAPLDQAHGDDRRIRRPAARAGSAPSPMGACANPATSWRRAS